MSLSNFNSSEANAILSTLQAPADKLGNDPSLEQSWAIKAFKHAEVYMSLIRSVDTRHLKLTKIDDEVYTGFRSQFADFSVATLCEDEIKSPEGKVKWREFCNQFEHRVDDWNMATLLRANASDEDITPDNTILVPRIQFLAIEIARNREGLNSALRQKAAASDR